MRLQILDLAEADLLRGFRFYERKARGVGWYFLDTLSAEIESLHLYAGVHRQYFGYFRMLSRRFPYAIYYRTAGEEVQVASAGLPAQSPVDSPPAQEPLAYSGMRRRGVCMNKLLAAIVEDDRRAVAKLLTADHELAKRVIEKPKLYRSKICHWIYVGDTDG